MRQPVPDHRAEKTDHSHDRDQCNCSYWIERFDDIYRLDHVHPENEIENRLRQPMRTRIDQNICQPPNSAPITSTTLLGLVTARCSESDGSTCALAGRNLRAEFAGRLAKDPFESAIELRQRLKPNVVGDFANAKIRV